MRADDHINFAGSQCCVEITFLRGTHAAEQGFDAVAASFKDADRISRMLFRKYLGRRHQGRLIAVFHCREHRQEGNDRFAAADVTLFEIGKDVADDFFLGVRQPKRDQFAKPRSCSVANLDDAAFWFFLTLAAQQLHRERQPEEFVEDQPPVRRASKHLVFGKR